MPDDDEEDARDAPSEADVYRFSAQTRRCPRCRREVYDEIDLCPKCGFAFDAEGPARPPWWVIAGTIGALAGMLLFFFR